MAVFLAIAFVRWQFHDDLAFQMQLDNEGLFGFCLNKYLNWDARFMTPFGFTWFFLYKFIGFPFLLFFVSVCFFASSWLIIKLIKRQFELNLSSQTHFIVASVLNVCLWYSLNNILSFTLYWMTASSYVLNIMLALLWANSYFSKHKNGEQYKLAFYLFSFIVAASCQNISLGLCGIVFIDLIVEFLNRKVNGFKQFLKQFKLMVVFGVGVVAATISPGSFVQLQKMQADTYSSQTVQHGIKHYIDHFIHLYVEAFKSNGVLLLASAVVLVLSLILLSQSKYVLKKVNWSHSLKFKNLLADNKWYFAAFFALMIYWPTLLYSDRYYIGFYFFLFIALSMSIMRLFEKKESDFDYGLGKVSIGFILAGGAYLFFMTFAESSIIHKFMEERHKYLEENRGAKVIYLDALNFSKGNFIETNISSEIRKQANYHENNVLAKYYEIDSVLPKKYLSKEDLVSLQK